MQLDANSREIQVARYVGNPATINLSTSSASAQLQARTVYRLWSSVNCFFVLGTSGVSAGLSSNPMTAGIDLLLATDPTNTTIAAIVSTGSGVLYISQLDAVSD